MNSRLNRGFTNRKEGLSFAEVIISVFVAMVLSIPILLLMTSTRTHTGKAINYLRAIELAHESIEWVHASILNPDTIEKFTGNSGSLVTSDAGGFKSATIPLEANPKWEGNVIRELAYHDQYTKCFFYRKVEVKPATGFPLDYLSHLFQVDVTVSWNESKYPDDPQSEERMHKVVFSTLVCDEKREY